MYFENIHETDNNGYPYFKDSAENVTLPTGSVTFWDAERKGIYYEFIFDIPQEELNQYNLYGYFVTCDTLTEGNWKVTFPLEA